jgi:hypothetical protein
MFILGIVNVKNVLKTENENMNEKKLNEKNLNKKIC